MKLFAAVFCFWILNAGLDAFAGDVSERPLPSAAEYEQILSDVKTSYKKAITLPTQENTDNFYKNMLPLEVMTKSVRLLVEQFRDAVWGRRKISVVKFRKILADTKLTGACEIVSSKLYQSDGGVNALEITFKGNDRPIIVNIDESSLTEMNYFERSHPPKLYTFESKRQFQKDVNGGKTHGTLSFVRLYDGSLDSISFDTEWIVAGDAGESVKKLSDEKAKKTVRHRHVSATCYGAGELRLFLNGGFDTFEY